MLIGPDRQSVSPAVSIRTGGIRRLAQIDASRSMTGRQTHTDCSLRMHCTAHGPRRYVGACQTAYSELSGIDRYRGQPHAFDHIVTFVSTL